MRRINNADGKYNFLNRAARSSARTADRYRAFNNFWHRGRITGCKSSANWLAGSRIATKTRFSRRQKLSAVSNGLLFDVLSRKKAARGESGMGRGNAANESCFATRKKTGRRIESGARGAKLLRKLLSSSEISFWNCVQNTRRIFRQRATTTRFYSRQELRDPSNAYDRVMIRFRWDIVGNKRTIIPRESNFREQPTGSAEIVAKNGPVVAARDWWL